LSAGNLVTAIAVNCTIVGACVGAQISHDVSVTWAVQFSGSIGAWARYGTWYSAGERLGRAG
jgi:membrane protein DedA with SNARE-associated domain